MVPTLRLLQSIFVRTWTAGMLLAAASVAPAAEFDAKKWRIVTPEELAMKSEPLAPGAPAIYLYTQVDREDTTSSTRLYEQVKILTEEGRDRANIEIQYNKAAESIHNIEARVVQPDGTIVPFAGTIYDRPIASGREVKIQAKSFALPDVQVGSIIEYRYVYQQDVDSLYKSTWVLSQDLFTRFARYSIAVYGSGNARWSYRNGLPDGTSPPVAKARVVRLETHNVRAFVTEQYMPPINDLRYLVEFYYVGDEGMETRPSLYWKKFGQRQYMTFNRFSGDSPTIRRTLAGIVAPGDSPVVKVRKIYDHVQSLRNTTYAPRLDEKDGKRIKEKYADGVSEVAKRGYGDQWELLCYFMALVRAADIPAEPALVGGRAYRFFNENILNSDQLDSTVIAVTVDGRDLLLKPGVPFLPFGAQLWSDTAVKALKLNNDGGVWITMPLPDAGDAVTSRKAKLTLNEEGELEGTLEVTYNGREALWRRLQLRLEDEQGRREFLEQDLKSQLAAQAQIKVVRQPDWSGTGPLQVEYQLKLPEWTVASGNRLLVGAGIFGGEEKGIFIASKRVHPLYFTYPFRDEDELQIMLPPGYRLQGALEPVPASRASGLKYSTRAEFSDGKLIIRRDLSVSILLSGRESYPTYRDFYGTVRAGDEQKVVLVH